VQQPVAQEDHLPPAPVLVGSRPTSVMTENGTALVRCGALCHGQRVVVHVRVA
jgi:hypothetical protein